MKLSILIPVYNEESTILQILRQVNAVKLTNIQKEIIVVDDASKDNSYKLLKPLKNIKLYRHTNNKGKGAAVRTAIANSTGDIILIQDADLEYNPSDYPRLLQPILNGRAMVVYGTRLKSYPVRLFGSKRTPLFTHYIGNKLLTFATNLLYNANLTDMETCYKVFKADILKGIPLTSNRFEIEPEITAKLLKRKIKIYEVPIKVNPRGYEEGKKITWKDGLAALKTLIKYKFTS